MERDGWRLATETLTKASWTPKRSPWRGVTWLVGGVAALIAATIAVLVAIAFFVFAVVTAVLLILRGAFRGPRPARPRDGPMVIDAQRVGGHSWVAYGWDGRH